MEHEGQIIQLNYNWYASNENGEEFQCFQVGATYGNKKCEKIYEHRAMGDGDKWYYDAYFSDGSIERIFNPNKVFYK